MESTASAVITWLAPILSTIIITAATASINAQVQKSQRVADERHEETEAKRAAEAKWQDSVMTRLDNQDDKINSVLEAQCTQMRSDLIHRAHRYIDDLGCASVEEKEAFYAEYEDYQRICEAHEIVNHFIDELAEKVMALPNRDINA